MSDIVKATPEDIGCYVDGWWGQYGTAHMIERATEFGYDDSDVIELAQRHLATMHRSSAPEITDDEYWVMVDGGGDVEEWLNENVAPEGYWFGWQDGEFYLQSADWWEE